MSVVLRPPLPSRQRELRQLMRARLRRTLGLALPWSILLCFLLLLLNCIAMLIRGRPDSARASAGLFFFPPHATVTPSVGGPGTIFTHLSPRPCTAWPADFELPFDCYGPGEPLLRTMAGTDGRGPVEGRYLDMLAVAPRHPADTRAELLRALKAAGLRVEHELEKPARRGRSGCPISGMYVMEARGRPAGHVQRAQLTLFTDDDMNGWTLFHIQIWLAGDAQGAQ